jgi:hypothetical protein
MPSYGQSVTLQYVAWNTSSNSGQTGDAANHTLHWIKDGTEDLSTLPTGSEVDSTNCPGVYKASITATQCQCQIGTLCGKSSTANVVILPVSVTFENLPTAGPATSGGLPTIGTGSGQISLSSGAVTAGTVSDKTGYSLAASQTFSTSGSVGGVAGAVGSVTGLTTSTIAAAILASPAHPLQTDSSGNALISLSQAVGMTGNTANSVGDCLNAARAQGFGKWMLSGTTLTLYGSDGSTVVKTFTLDSASAPTQRS